VRPDAAQPLRGNDRWANLRRAILSSTCSIASRRARRLRSLPADPSNSSPTGNPLVMPAGRTTLGNPAELLGCYVPSERYPYGYDDAIDFDIETRRRGRRRNQRRWHANDGRNDGSKSVFAEVVSPCPLQRRVVCLDGVLRGLLGK
jgi:hypothetical protein